MNIEQFGAYLKRTCAVNPKHKDEKLTEVQQSDGTYHAVNAEGKVRAIYGESTRAAIQKLKKP